MSGKARYYPEIFNAADVDRAKAIILTPEGPGADTAARWALESHYVIELISEVFPITADSTILDYGCGIGRLAKAMIDAFGCRVVGVDISRSMRDHAVDYVGSERFVAVSPEQFDGLVTAGLRAHAAIAVWVLQHCFRPDLDIARMRRGLVEGGGVFVLNMRKRAVPGVRDGTGEFAWFGDSVDVASLLRSVFHVEREGEPDMTRTPNMASAGTFWLALRVPG